MLEHYDTVYTMTEYYDGPRAGVADFQGAPHLYDCIWDDQVGNYSDRFELRPISGELFQLCLEDWEIWERWDTAYKQGLATLDTHPALPEDRLRHEEIKSMMDNLIAQLPGETIAAKGDFQVKDGQFVVCWHDVHSINEV